MANGEKRIANGQTRITIADIPGLIEGASAGKGLGDKFLKHIEKVKVILHCISCETNDLAGDYKKIRKELEEYNPALLAKKEIIILTKMDTLCDDTARLKLKQSAEGLASTVVFCSILDDTTISNLTDVIVSSV
jgi:GTP-binding protein